MGSTSETYKNGTNVVLYVTNENAQLQSQQLQQQYHSHNIISSNLHSTNDNESAYDVGPEYGSSAITVLNYEESDSIVVAEKSLYSFNVSQQNVDSDDCTINGDSMRDNTNYVSYHEGDKSENLLINNNSCFVDNQTNFESAPVSTVTASSNEPSAADFVANADISYVRCDSVRSVDSVASGCSSLSSSSVGNPKVVLANQNFIVDVNVNANYSTNGNCNSKHGVAFPQFRIVPIANKEPNTSSFHKSSVSVPYGWQRLLNNGAIIYISPSSSVLTSLEQVNSYLLTDGNCFCGLDCPLFLNTVFNFDPEVVTSAAPVTTPSGFAKLCNHKRKRITQNNVPSASLPNQSYESIPLQSNSVASPFITNYCNPGAVVKKHVFDISDRRKKRKIMPGQIYVNDDTSESSPNIMVHNDCDISAKENNPVITIGSQVESPVYNPQIGMTVNMLEPQITPPIESGVRLKAPVNQSYADNQTSAYCNGKGSQDFRYSFPSNDCYTMNPHLNKSVPNLANMFLPQDEYTINQNSSKRYLCNSIANNKSPQQCDASNLPMSQHHHTNYMANEMQPQHILFKENDSRSPHLPANPSQVSQIQQPSHISMVSLQQQEQQYQYQHPIQLQQHHALNQQPNFQQMHVVPSHHHHHHHMYHQHNNDVKMNGIPKHGQMVQENNFSNKQMSHQCHERNHSCDTNMALQCENSFCNCYHNTGHSHQSQHSMQQQAQNSGSSECSNTCSSVIVQNAQGQQIIMQQSHHMVTHDSNTMIQPQIKHHQNTQQCHPVVHNEQIQSPVQQMYQHHIHQSQHHQQQQQHQQQHMQLHQQHQQHQHQLQLHQQQQQMHIMQHQQQNNDMKNTQSRCNQMIQMNNIRNTGNIELVTRNQQQFLNHSQVNNLIPQRAYNMMWQQKNAQHMAVNNNHNSVPYPDGIPIASSPPNMYERVPPLHPHVPPLLTNWNEETSRKKVMKSSSKSQTNAVAKKMKISFGSNYPEERSLPNQISNSTTVTSNMTTSTNIKDKNEYSSMPVPSFMEDPSGYLAQQTALLNSTISKQTGENPSPKERSSCFAQSKMTMSAVSNNQSCNNDSTIKTNIFNVDCSKSRIPQAKTPDSSMQNDFHFSNSGSSKLKNCSPHGHNTHSCKPQNGQLIHQHNQLQYEENPVTSSTYSDRERNVSVSPTESRSPIQAGTVSTSNQSPTQPGMISPNVCSTPSTNNDMLSQSPAAPRQFRDSDDSSINSGVDSPKSSCQFAVTAVVSGHTCSSNTVTSVLAGKTNTAVVSMNNTNHQNISNIVISGSSSSSGSNSGSEDRSSTMSSLSRANISVNCHVPQVESQITKSPLEMVQNVVSSIQIPCSETKTSSISQNSFQTSHFLVSNNGQFLMATSGNPSQAVVSQQNLTKVNSSVSMINNSSVVTNVTGTVTQVIPTVNMTQRVLGQPTMLVNTLPSGQLVFQPSVMALDSAGNAVQIPQLAVATNNVVSGQTIADAAAISVATSGSFSPRGQAQLLSPETGKRKVNGKKRKISTQQMIQIASASQNGIINSSQNGSAAINSANAATSVVVQPQTQPNFTQGTPMLQTLILPNKNNQFANSQQLIATANLLHPVNLVHNIPTIQQFIVPAGLSGMVMNADGTATILPETVQLNVLTPVQNATGGMFSHTSGQGILTASPAASMVIRAQPNGNATTQLRPQAIRTPNGAQFITTQPPNQFIVNNSANFSSQLSPIVANMSPNQQIHTFNSSPNGSLSRGNGGSTAPEYIQCVNSSMNGQTLMVPCSVSQANTSPQNTTVVQQNTTIVQQQMTMVSNNQQLPETSSQNSVGVANQTSNLNLGQHNLILNDGKQPPNFIITTTEKASAQPQTGYILSPKGSVGQDKQSSGTHIILNNLNTDKQSQRFIISSPSSDKQHFILTNTSEKSNARGNFILSGSQAQSIERSHHVNRFAKHSVSTQTAAAAAAAAAANNQQVLQISSTPTLIVATNNTFSQTSSSYSGSPPDTTTHSPIGNSGQSPDTPSSSIVVGSTDDLSSPTSSTSLGSDLQRQPMVHCISSSNVVDWSDNTIDEKKVNIIVDRRSSEIITGIDMFSTLGSVQPHFQRRSSLDTKENIAYIESSTFDETSFRK